MDILPYLLFLIFLIAVVGFAVKFLLGRVELIPEGSVGIVERQGRFIRVLDAGRHFLLPFDRIRQEVPLQEFEATLPLEKVVMHNAVIVDMDMYLQYRIAHYSPQQVSPEQARQMQPEPVIKWSRGRIRQRDVYNAIYKVDNWQDRTQKEAKAILRGYMGAIDVSKDIFNGPANTLKQISAIIKKQLNERTLQYGVEITEIILSNPKVDESTYELLTSVSRSQIQNQIKQMEAETQAKIQQMEADVQARIQQTLKLSREELLQWSRTEAIRDITQNNPNARIYVNSDDLNPTEGSAPPRPGAYPDRPADNSRPTRNEGERR
ncbi:MAG: SPFH domain-containing protein [Chloroflexota bacterium]|nr:SPFH domain-containing protein [Chloroflexota bacterium]